MAKSKVSTEVSNEVTVGKNELADAIVQAIEAAKPPAKKTAFNRTKNTPWSPKDGSPRLKLKRKTYQHSLELGDNITNEEISLCNKLKPGTYCDGWVRVTRRRDKGIDIDYPIRTASQRLKLVNSFGIRTFAELLERLVAEAENPVKYVDIDDFD